MVKKSKAKGVAAALKRTKKPTPAKKKPPKAKSPAKVPVSGQSAPLVELSTLDLNEKELKVLVTLNGSGAGVRSVLSITILAETCFKAQKRPRANSWTRNSLRRLVSAGLVEKVERGRYRVALAARKKLARAA